MTHREQNPELFDFIVKVSGFVFGLLVTIQLGLTGWLLLTVDGLNTTVAVHTTLLSQSHDDLLQVKDEINTIYMSRSWRNATSTMRNDTATTL